MRHWFDASVTLPNSHQSLIEGVEKADVSVESVSIFKGAVGFEFKRDVSNSKLGDVESGLNDTFDGSWSLSDKPTDPLSNETP